MYKTFTLPLKSAFALSAFFILTACGGFTIDINLPASTDCFANPFVTECDQDEGVDAYRKSLISNCADNPNRADTQLCRAADAWVNPPSDDENGAEVVDNTPKDTEIKSEFNKNSLIKTDKEKIETTSLEIVDFCIDPANVKHARCSPEVIDCINNPFSGSCEDNNLLGNLVRGGVTVSKAVILQDKRAVDCRDGNVDSSQCRTLNSEKQRCTGAVFSDASCSAVTHSVCKADAFDPLCVDNTDYDVARATACEADPTVSSDCPAAPVPEVVDVCLDNPFGLTCTDSVYNNARRDLVKTCAIQAVTGAVTSACDTIIAEARPCLINPFDTACDANPAVRSHIGLLRSSRVVLCKNDTRLFDRWIAPLCTGAPVAKSVCAIDPFNTVCIGDNDYDNSRLSACRGGLATTGQCGNIIAGVCGNNPFDTLCGSGYTQNRRALCTDDPFTPRCTGDVYSDLRVNFCDVNAGTHPSCPSIDTTPNQVTAADWLASFDEPLATAASRDHPYSTESQFLIGRATDLDDGGIDYYSQHSGSNTGFTLADATFNGVALGGDATDGVAYFKARGNGYAGVLSGTNLGAPLTDTTGSAKWIGSFQLGGFDPIDFVLTVSFGTGTGAGEVEALVQNYSYFFDHYIKGEFNDAGVITGTAYQGVYRTPDPANRGALSVHQDSGKLTGLIGEEGAVGTFIIDRSGFASSGGFVARPSSEAELATLEQTCANDPFNKLCTIGYESERNARIEHCIIDDNANDGICRSANQLHVCIKHPFRADCWVYLSQYYEQARANRLAFCRAEGNARNEVCTVRSTVSYICTNYPFDAACLGDDRFTRLRKIACSDDPFATRCAGDVYNDLRVSFCENNAGNPACPTPEPTITEPTITEVATPQVTASVWADSFEQPLSHGATAGGRTQFLIGKETDLDTGGVGILHNGAPNYSGTSTLADATFNGVALGGDAADGISYFAAAGGGKRYAGVLSGTNLGAPLTDTQGSAKWIGSFILEGSRPTDFVLNISFGIGDGVGEVEAFTREIYDYHIQGEFDDAGVITGTARWGRYKTYKTNNVGWEVGSGKLTGLIGEEGAVGAFLISGWYGGFVARPPTAKELQDLTQTCNDDPFNRLCSVGYESQRNALIEHCITGGNGNDERCDSVDNWHPCIRDPFDRCGGSFLNDYGQVRANRVAFCRTAGNANNALCTVEATYHYICTNHPFDAQCLSNNDYTPIRRTTCLDDPFTTRCAGDVYNDLRVTFCTRNAGNPACPRPVVPDTTPNRVTAADWVASFETTPLTEPVSYGGQFLQGNETKLNPGALFPDIEWMTSRTFANTGYGFVVDSNTDAVGGYSYFQGYTGRSSTTHYYAGILSNTDLGAPLTQTSGSLYWKGSASYSHRRPGSGTGADRSMILKISFGNGGQGNAGKVTTTINADLFESRFDLEGVFNHQGVISGTATLIHNETRTFGSLWAAGNRYAGTQISGVLSGLIGQKGAVGAFYSKRKASDTGKGIFGGGFVVMPSFVNVTTPASASDQVTTADWLASFKTGLDTTPIYRNKNYFLRGTQTGLNTGEFTDLGVKPTVHSLTLADVTLNGNAYDGVAFFKGGLDVIEIELGEYAYAGILSDTDLGAPLTPSSGTVSWQGKFASAFSTGNNSDTSHFIKKNFTLEISFDNAGSGNVGKITSIINATDTEFEIDGVFNSQGVISGAVSTIRTLPFPDGSLSDNRYINRGLLTGLIGEEGAIGAFVSPPHITIGFAGGFVAVPNFVDLVTPVIPTPIVSTTVVPTPTPTPTPTTNRVTVADWLATFDGGLPKSADLNDSAGSRFIESKANDLDTGGMTTGGFFAESRKYQTRVYNLNFDTATFSRQYLNGDGEDGVAFFSGSNNDGETISYAGILSGTDLGAPVNQTGRATWNGQIANTVWKSIPKDFSLNIDFDGQGQGGSIEGFSQLYSSRGIYGHIDLAGRFDANGVISGTVKQGNFAGYTRNSLIDGYEQAGVLTGLIGQEGAVGAFIFERDETRVGWAGGFVVRPSEAFIPQAPLVNNAQVTTADWLASVKQGLYSMPYQFIEASKTGLSIINDNGADHHVLTLADSTFDGRDLGGDRADGVAFSRGKNSRDWHMQSMGVLSGSDLGAPLTQQQGTVYWEGKIIALSGINEIFKDFKLQINFGQGDQVGTISAFVAMKHPDLGHHYRLDGSFDTNGVIKGTTESGMFMAQDAKIPQYWRRSGTLTGLIGEEGAVGAFFSNRGGSTGYVGGFVAKPNVTPATIPTPVAQAPVDRVTKDVWLSTLGKQEISSDTPYITAQSNFSSGLGIDGEANNGFFFKDSSGSGFSEILSGTDLGAPLTQTTGSLRWNGLFVSGRDGWTTGFFQSDFVLEVSFGGPEGYAGRIDAIFEMYTTRSANLAIYLRGVFDDNGVISGRILYGSEFLDIRDTSTDYQSFQSLTGLIGQKGAVGVIDPSPGYTAAGFIASPKSTIDLVHYADWKVPFLKKVPELASYNQFIASTQGGLDVGRRLKNADGTAAVVNTLNFNSADSIDGGVAFTSGFISGKKGFFATVLDTVNLGEPVTLTSGSAIWQGKFKAVIGDRIVNKDLDLTVDFGNERISAGVQDTGNYYLSIDGSYNENGFIEGTTSYGTSSVNSDGSRDLPGTNGNVGTLKGLIGQKGAVGAFISKDNAATRNSKNTIGYSGGFVAAPPSQ